MPAAESSIDIPRIRDQLTAAVRDAGALALLTFRTALKSWIKGRSSPVSEADLAVDALLRKRLLAVHRAGWLSEETEDDPARLHEADVWVVDPIDGTRAYLAGSSDWAVSAAFVRLGRPMMGALYAPAMDELFLAVAGGGATRNGKPIKATGGDTIAGARFSATKRRLEVLSALEPRIEAVPRVPSLALRLARVAMGELDGTFTAPNSHDWDLAAADLLVHEAGGRVTTLRGEPLIYNRPLPVHGALIAAGARRHGVLLDLIQHRIAELT